MRESRWKYRSCFAILMRLNKSFECRVFKYRVGGAECRSQNKLIEDKKYLESDEIFLK
jgi:hypothetical protein